MNFKKTLINILLFPGIVAHEFGHKLFCDMFNIKVHKICYFSFRDPVGFVVHDHPKNFTQTFFITVGPFIFNTLLSTLFAIFSMNYSLFFIWPSVSIAMQSFPSSGDSRSLWKETKRHIRKNILAVIGFPISGLIMLINLIRRFWIDLIYGIGFYIFIVFFFF